MNNSLDGSPNKLGSNKLLDKSVISKVKNLYSSSENEPSSSVQNGTISYDEKCNNTESRAECSYLVSMSSSLLFPASSCINQVPVDIQNGECSSEKYFAKGRTLSSEENDSRNHDKKRKTGYFLDSENSSGNEEEGLSSDDCCIYTYKGDQLADLPNSLFSNDMAVNGGRRPARENHRKANYRREGEDKDLGSSPEMDYLEMDFDPGPFFEQDSEEDLNCCEGKSCSSPEPELLNKFKSDKNEEDINKSTIKKDLDNKEVQAGPSNINKFNCSFKRQNEISDYNSNSFNRTKSLSENCCAGFCTVVDGINETNKGVNEALGKIVKRSSVLSSDRLNKKVLTVENDSGASNKNEGDSKMSIDGIMLWSEQEAISKQVMMVSSEVSCAAAAVINAMLVLKMRISIEKVKQGISTRLKTESVPIPQYLISRSFAGVADESGIHHASHGLLYARFFQMYPRRDIILTKWLIDWMNKGAVPIATMNVQRGPTAEGSTIEIRHHQMIFGVNLKGIFLTNPSECLQEEELWSRLVSPSVLKIKRSEIVSRWTPDANLKPLMFQTDERWKEMNVLGQVVNIIREFSDPGAQGKFLTEHILIPAISGITLVVPRHSPAYEELASTADLPLLSK